MSNSQINNKLKELEDSSSKSKFWNITWLQGKYLSNLVKLKKASNILELGTSNGYSTLHLAKNLDKTGKITTIEIEEERFELAKKNFKEVGINEQICQIKGEIVEILENKKLKEKFDLIFIDAAHKEYEKILNLIIEQNIALENAIIIFDNVISHKYMDEFVEKTSRIYNTNIINIGGGFLVIYL